MSAFSRGKITDYFKPITTNEKNSPSKPTASNQLSLDQACDAIIKQYKTKLQLEAERRGKILVMIGDIWLWCDHVYDASDTQKKDPKIRKRILQQLVDFLQGLPYAFITRNANQNLSRISEAQYMVDRDHWLGERTTVRPSSYKLQVVFETELKLVDELVEIQRFDLATDLLIALLLGLKECPDGFWRCYNPSEALGILDHFGSLWQQTMHSDMITMTDRNRECLHSGYIRETAHEFRMKIPLDIAGVISYYDQSVLDDQSKRVLYDLMATESANLMKCGFRQRGFRFGPIPDGIVDFDGHKKVQLDIIPDATNQQRQPRQDDTKWTIKQLKARTTEQLRAFCLEEQQCPIDVVGSDRQTLIEYLYQPKDYVLYMKRKYHYEQEADAEYFFLPDEDPKDIDISLAQRHAFDERRYLVRGGVVVERDAFWCEIRGQPLEYDDRDEEELIAEALQKKKVKDTKKRDRAENEEAVRAAKKRKLNSSI